MEKSEFDKISHISGIRLEQERSETIQKEFELILEHIGNIDKLSTEDLVPLYHLNEEQYLRSDTPSKKHEEFSDLLYNSPNKKGDYVEFEK